MITLGSKIHHVWQLLRLESHLHGLCKRDSCQLLQGWPSAQTTCSLRAANDQQRPESTGPSAILHCWRRTAANRVARAWGDPDLDYYLPKIGSG